MRVGARNVGANVASVAVLVMGILGGSAPAAMAHGDHGAVPVVLSYAVGPYVVSVWVEEFSDRTQTVSAVIDGHGVAEAPELWVQGADGRRSLTGLVDEGAGKWTIVFGSSVGDALILASGGDELAPQIGLSVPPAPAWFRSVLLAVTPIGVWFMYWLAKRRRRVFGPYAIVE